MSNNLLSSVLGDLLSLVYRLLECGWIKLLSLNLSCMSQIMASSMFILIFTTGAWSFEQMATTLELEAQTKLGSDMAICFTQGLESRFC